MTTPINMALYRLLVKGGATETEAEAAARLDTSDLATKGDLSQLKASLIMWMVGIVFTALTLQTALIIFTLARSGQ